VSDADVRHDARLLQMADARQLDTILVDSLLADPNSSRRARATLAIGQVKGKARYGRLRELLLDADTAVAANAALLSDLRMTRLRCFLSRAQLLAHLIPLRSKLLVAR